MILTPDLFLFVLCVIAFTISFIFLIIYVIKRRTSTATFTALVCIVFVFTILTIGNSRKFFQPANPGEIAELLTIAGTVSVDLQSEIAKATLNDLESINYFQYDQWMLRFVQLQNEQSNHKAADKAKELANDILTSP